MKILTFDTSAETMFITIGDNDIVINSRIIGNTKERYHSALLIPMIIELLQENSLTMQNIHAIGVNVGPGSFTGIRASATVARVMAQNLDIPVIGIPSLEIISLLNNTDKNAICLLDARKNKAYTGIYTHEGDEIQKPQALDYDIAVDIARNNDYFVITDSKMTDIIRAEGIDSINLQETRFNFGLSLAKLTYKHLLRDNLEQHNWFNLKPLYIQPPPISMPKIVCK